MQLLIIRVKKIKDKIEHHHGEEILNRKHRHNHHKDCVVVYSDEIEDKIDIIEEALVEKIWSIT